MVLSVAIRHKLLATETTSELFLSSVDSHVLKKRGLVLELLSAALKHARKLLVIVLALNHLGFIVHLINVFY